MDTPAHPFVLLVDDDKLFGGIISRRFGAESVRMVHVTSGQDALRILQQEDKPDLLLLDLQLAGMEGFELLEKIRAEPAISKLPVVVLSNFNDPADVERGKTLGVLRHIQKVTLTPREVVDMAREVLGGGKGQ